MMMVMVKVAQSGRIFVTAWTVAHKAPLSMEFSKQEYWNGLPIPTPGDLPNPGTEPTSLMSPALASEFFTTSDTREAPRAEYASLTIPAAQGRLHSLACDHIQSKSFQPLLLSSFFDFTLLLTPQPISYIGTNWII